MSFNYGPYVPYGPDFVANGYLVAIPMNPSLRSPYLGVQDNTWPIEWEDARKLDVRLGIPPANQGVNVATHWGEVLPYWGRCLELGLPARLLLVSTRYLEPQVTPPDVPWQRLGYDVAHATGNHSALAHEVVGVTAPQLQHWRARLNEAGLFEDLATAEAFLAEREELVRQGRGAGICVAHDFYFAPMLLHLYTGPTPHPDHAASVRTAK
jgi:hypothetical protein